MIRIGSLFSGIGGLELGIERAAADAGFPVSVAWQVEFDAYCRAVLAKHWPDADRSVIDVRCADASLPWVDILTGGPPCQDISGAGRQEALFGERSGLLFEYLRIVRELRPRVCVVENVHSGQWRVWLDAIRCGFIRENFRVRVGIIRASDVGAPHARSRVIVVAHANGTELREQSRGLGWSCGSGEAIARRSSEALVDARGSRLEGSERASVSSSGGRSVDGSGGSDGAAEAQSGLGRDAHGLSGRVDLPARWPAGRGALQEAWEPPRTTATSSKDGRRHRLRGIGNAVVPACSYVIGRDYVVPLL